MAFCQYDTAVPNTTRSPKAYTTDIFAKIKVEGSRGTAKQTSTWTMPQLQTSAIVLTLLMKLNYSSLPFTEKNVCHSVLLQCVLHSRILDVSDSLLSLLSHYEVLSLTKRRMAVRKSTQTDHSTLLVFQFTIEHTKNNRLDPQQSSIYGPTITGYEYNH